VSNITFHQDKHMKKQDAAETTMNLINKPMNESNLSAAMIRM